MFPESHLWNYERTRIVDKDELVHMTQDSKYIEGVDNYCDRWCERCPLTSHCLNYAIAEENFSDLGSHDIQNQAFWSKLGEMFEVTIQMLTDWAEEQGINLDELDIEAATEADRRRREQANNHEIARLAKTYGELVETWFNREGGRFDQREEALNTIVQLGVGGEDPFEEADHINDAIEVIHWYQHQIHIKLMRALSQTCALSQTEDEFVDADDVQNDANGSTKVSLIGIDRSIAAWGKLRQYFPECGDDILDTLIALDRLRRQAEYAFPNARAFVRPGFDTIDLSPRFQ